MADSQERSDAVKRFEALLAEINSRSDLDGDAAMQLAIEGHKAARAEGTRFVLDDAQWAAFQARLDQPARDIPAVRELFARRRPT